MLKILDTEKMPYPRICAHRGFSAIAPESTMVAFAGAIALGAEEIEMDLWQTTDGVIVSSHDRGLERVSNGTGDLKNHSYKELMELDFGGKFGPEFAGMKIASFEEITKRFAGQVIMNLHLRHEDEDIDSIRSYVGKIVEIIERYGNEKYCYFMASNIETLMMLKESFPQIERCAGELDESHPCMYLLERAIIASCSKIQLFSPYFERGTREVGEDFVSYIVKKAHENGIICNLCIADEPHLTREYLAKGVDTLLTNRAQVTKVIRDEFIANNK